MENIYSLYTDIREQRIEVPFGMASADLIFCGFTKSRMKMSQEFGQF